MPPRSKPGDRARRRKAKRAEGKVEQAPPVQMLEVEPPKRTPVTLVLKPKVTPAEVDIQAQSAHTYNIDFLRSQRHTSELASPEVFQFLAETQLYRRFLLGGRRGRVEVMPTDMASLQHRINAIMFHFNSDTFQSVFSEILSLGIESEDFVVGYVNVVFKQAVLNPALALLFASLTQSVVYVAQRTVFGERIRTLMLERFREAFDAPQVDTDKGVSLLLRGIAVFGGHMMRNGLLPDTLLSQWIKDLTGSPAIAAVDLLIHLLSASGMVLINQHQSVLAHLEDKMRGRTEKDLVEPYEKLLELIKGAVEPMQQSAQEMKAASMKRSPSVDRELDVVYPKLFKKSGSIPSLLELSQLAGDEEESMSSIVTQYFYNPELSDFLEGLKRLNYSEGDVRTAEDVIRAIIEQPDENQSVVARLVIDLLGSNMYTDADLTAAIQKVAGENASDVVKGRHMAALYARLLNDRIVAYDDFETLLSGMRSVWSTAVETVFTELNKLQGCFIDDMLESEYWKNVTFLGVESITDKLAKLSEWGILSFLPQYETVASFKESATSGSLNVKLVTEDDSGMDQQDVAPLIFEVMCSFDDAVMRSAATNLKKWFQSCPDVIADCATKCGAAGEKLAAMLQ